MELLRTIFAIVMAISLAILPARVGAIGVRDAHMTMPLTADCISMTGDACDSTVGMRGGDDVAPMTDGCDRFGDHGTIGSGACYTYCNSASAFPIVPSLAVEAMLIAPVAVPATAVLRGISLPPEPHPPKAT